MAADGNRRPRGVEKAVSLPPAAPRTCNPLRAPVKLSVGAATAMLVTHSARALHATHLPCSAQETERLKDEVVSLNHRLALAASRCSDFGGPGGPPANWSGGKLSDPGPQLPPLAREQFRKNGHVVLRNFIAPDELASFAPAVRETVVDHRHDWDRYVCTIRQPRAAATCAAAVTPCPRP